MDAWIGLGSNMGDRIENLGEALRRVQEPPHTSVVAVSHAYESEPWGVTDQPAFANAVALLHTTLEADRLLGLLKDVEESMGRVPGERYGPRAIDLDILLFGDEEWRSEALTIPHPRLLERDFVVTPLLELWPDASLPDGTRVTHEAATEGRVLGDLGPIPGWGASTARRTEATRGGEGARRGPEGRAAGPETFGGPPASTDFRYRGSAETIRTASGEEWVGLGVSRLDPSPATGDLLFYETVLREAGIPCEFYPNRPNESMNPYGISHRIDLFVPASRLQEARDLIDDVRRARPVWDRESE